MLSRCDFPSIQVPDRPDVPAMQGWQLDGGAGPAPNDKEKRVHLLVGRQRGAMPRLCVVVWQGLEPAGC